MPDTSRLRTPDAIAQLIDTALIGALTSDDPWPSLERAHIASQPWAWAHTRVHAAMLRVAWRQRDRRELLGQLIRIAVAGPGSLAGRYPPGNTGRTTMGITEHGSIPADLAGLLPTPNRHPVGPPPSRGSTSYSARGRHGTASAPTPHLARKAIGDLRAHRPKPRL